MMGGGLLLFFFSKEMLFAVVNTHHSLLADVIFYYISQLGEAHTIVLCLLVMLGISSLRNWWYFATATLCNIVPTILEQWMKKLYSAPRPLNYFHHAAWIHVKENWPQLMNNSFPSGHSTGSFAFFCFLSLLLKERYRKFALLFFAMALAVCYARIYLAAHFFGDVYTGSIIGCITCLLMFALMRKYQYAFYKKDALINIAP
jgi:membrane-associated phospholipid phosphatase